jgi:hypothetical protein
MRRQGSFRAFLSALLAGAAAGAFAAASAAGPVPTPPWLSHNGAGFGLTTTGDWEVSDTHADVKVLNVYARPAPKANEGWDRLGRMEIWAPTCLPGRQTVHLRRIVDLPGPVSNVAVVFTPQTSPGFSITSAEFWVNGSFLAEMRPQGYFAPARPNGRLFGFGRNTIELRVTKAPNPKGAAGCNRSSTTKVAIMAGVRAEFRTDLALLEPPPRDFTHDSPGENGVLGQLVFTVKNKGPGGAARGLFYLVVRLPAGQLAQVFDVHVPSNGPFEGCEVRHDQANVEWTIACYFKDFEAGQEYRFSVRYQSASSRPDGASVAVGVDWRLLMEGVDVNGSNNFRKVTVWHCGFGITDDGTACKPKP